MRSVRSLLQVIALSACASPVVAPAPAPVAAPVAVASVVCQDEAQAEKAYYEAQRLFQKKRYWEAAPAFVISYNFCHHAQVLCAAGQAYRHAQKCGKSAEMLEKCLGGEVPATARVQASKLLAGAQACQREPAAAAMRGQEEETAYVEDDSAFATQPWAGAAAAGKPVAP
jgi:hypothetical protein